MSQLGSTRQINQLNSSTQISGSDLFAIFSQESGDTRKVSLTEFVNWLTTQTITTQDNKVTQYAAPLTGSTVVVLDAQKSVWLDITPAGTIATLTITFPVSTNVVDKTEILITTTNTITALTLNGNGATIGGAVTTLAADGFVKYRFDGGPLKAWHRAG